MGKLSITTFLSIDGVMQAPGGPREDTSGGFRYGGWVFPFASEEFGEGIIDVFTRADAFVLGRLTYDIFAAHWPKANPPGDPIANRLNDLPKYVVSRSKSEFAWSPSSLLKLEKDEVSALKAEYSGELQVHGSCSLAQTLLRMGVVDELNLFTFPVLLGQGKRLFDGSADAAGFSLLNSTTTEKGVVISRYKKSGEVETGSFELPEDD